MNISWIKPEHVISSSKILLIALSVAVCTVAAQDAKTEEEAKTIEDAKTEEDAKTIEDVESLMKKAEAGDAVAQNWLGWMYADGEGVPDSEAKPAAWYRRAAAQGNAAAQNNLGKMYAIGDGMPENYAEAV